MAHDADIENFIKAFSSGAGSRRECECGKVYYNSSGGWDWDEGELEQLESNPNAIDVDYTVEVFCWNGKEYCADCKCWLKTIKQSIAGLENNRRQIVEFYKLERDRMIKEANELEVLVPVSTTKEAGK